LTSWQRCLGHRVSICGATDYLPDEVAIAYLFESVLARDLAPPFYPQRLEEQYQACYP
jgi:hypothetical protein